MNYVSRALNVGKSMDILYLDFKKAFDTVPHRRLILKLEALGIQGPALNWFENYLQGRVQQVRIGESVSSEKIVLSGVPQGSILGPLLFSIYVADLPRVISHLSKIRLFADDTKIFREISGKEDELELQKDLDNVLKWCKTWLLHLNVQKCKFIRFGGNSQKPNYTIWDESKQLSLEGVSQEKDLGVIFDENLTFRSHVDLKIKTAARNLALIRNSFKYADRSTFLLLYKSLVRPHLEYCSPVWNSSVKLISNKIENIQKRATKLVQDLKYTTYEDRLLDLDLPSLEFRRYREDIITSFKICKFNPALKNNVFLFARREGLRGHEFSFAKERCSARPFKNFLPNRIFSTWNDFPQTFPQIPNLNGLKTFIDDYFGRTRYSCHLTLSRKDLECLGDGATKSEVWCSTRVVTHLRA